MRVKRVAGLTVMLGIGVVARVLTLGTTERLLPVVGFSESKGRGSDRLAVFVITNTASRTAIRMGNVQVQVADKQGWRTISQDHFRASPFLEHGASDVRDRERVEACAHRKFVVEWPGARRWRVCVEYRRDAEGIEALVAKVRIIWATRTMLSWRSRVSVDPQWVASVEVQESSRTNHSSQQPPADP